MPTIEGPITECPECGSPVWDNRQNKKNPKGPDFKCKADKEHAYWLPKQAFPAKVAKPTPSPAEEFRASGVLPGTRSDDLTALYWECFDEVLRGLKERKLTDLFGKDIGALVSTLYIQRARG